MQSADFPYCKFSPDFNVCNCDEPCLSVTLKSGGKELTVMAMVDSGCTMTHANADLASELGIDLRTCIMRKSVGISGDAEDAWMTEVIFSFPGLGEDFNGPILFTKNLPVSVLLGQNNFFEKFDIHFRKSSHLFTLTRVK